MTAQRTLASRLKLIAAVTTLLIVIGAGGAAAYWTAAAKLDGAVQAATVGITQTDPLKLRTTYNSGNLTAADTVTIRNTGTAPAALSVVVGAQGGSSLPSTLRFAIAKKPGSEVCGPDTALVQPLTGGLGLMYTGTLEAGTSLDLCVRTSIPARAVFRLAGEQTGVTVTSTLKYAEGAAWTRTSAGTIGAPLAQSVQGDPAAGVPVMTCRERDIFDASTWYSLRFSYVGAGDPGAGEYRAYLQHGDRIIDIPRSKTTFHVNGKTVSTQIADDELVKIGAGLSLSQTMNARIIVEKKTPGSEEWTSAATGKIHIDGRLLLQNSVYCGWR